VCVCVGARAGMSERQADLCGGIMVHAPARKLENRGRRANVGARAGFARHRLCMEHVTGEARTHPIRLQ